LSAAGDAGEGPGSAGPSEASEEQLRAAYEEELSRITATDMMAQASVSLLNIGARRLASPSDAGEQSGRDLEQARDAIDGARALLEILERRIPQELRPLRDALSRLQMTYAREAGAAAAPPADGAAGEPGAGAPSSAPADGGGTPSGERPPGPGPAESSGRLWVPGR
jgi:hypothetical protein